MGDDTITGSNADDFPVGGAGNDSLIGGGGMDTLAFDAPLGASADLDTVLDFNPADDTIRLSGAVFAGVA